MPGRSINGTVKSTQGWMSVGTGGRNFSPNAHQCHREEHKSERGGSVSQTKNSNILLLQYLIQH